MILSHKMSFSSNLLLADGCGRPVLQPRPRVAPGSPFGPKDVFAARRRRGGVRIDSCSRLLLHFSLDASLGAKGARVWTCDVVLMTF